MDGEDKPTDMQAADSPVEERVLNGDTVGLVVLEAIAALEGTDPDDLGFQIQEYVDTDSLDSLVRNSAAELQIRLRIEEYIAVVTGQTVRCHRA